jgi:3-hydroxybutyryl-CoA dehydratase
MFQFFLFDTIVSFSRNMNCLKTSSMRQSVSRIALVFNKSLQRGYASSSVQFQKSEQFQVTGDIAFKNPQIGQKSSVKHIFSQEDVNSFAKLCGDNNPLHIDPEFGKQTMFGGTIVHGIFVSALFSTIFGRSLTGSIYVSQSLNFKRPVHVGKPVTAVIEVQNVEPRKKGDVITCSTVVKLEDGSVAVEGVAKVLLPSNKN